MNSVVTKIMFAGAKLALAAALALLTANYVSQWVANCPSVFDPVLGRVPKAGAEFNWRIEGDGHGVWTANGVRRASLPEGINAGNILVLGDSYTEALQVNDEEHVANRLEKKLFSAGINRPVLAVGRSGYSIADYAARARVFRRLFSPTWVIIQVCDSDFCQDAWQKDKPQNGAYFKQASPQGPLEVVALPSQNTGIVGYVNDHYPYLLPITLFAQDREGVVLGWLKDNRQPWFRADPESRRADVRPGMAAYPLEQECRLLAEAYDNRLTLLYLPPFDPEHPEEETENEGLLRAAAGKCGVHLASLRERFRLLAETGHEPYGFGNSRFNQGHWNRHGHAAAADILFETFSK